MLKFSQFLLSENAHHGLEKDVRADLNEEQFAHTMNKYIEGRSKAKASGETDWNKLHEAGLKHAKSALLTHEQLSDKGKAAFNNLSHKESEANRTLWDTHHGALSTIHALHKQGIHPDGKAEVMGGDVTGKGAAVYLRGEGKGHIEDPSDVVSHTEFKVGTRHKNGKQEGTQRGTLGLSLKYSASKEGDTKISQPKSARIIEYTGKWGAKAMKVLQKITSLRNAPREWIKKQPALTGLFPEDKITDKHLKMFRYANTALNPKNPPETRKTYKDRVKTHLSQMGITATREQNRAIKTIADHHNKLSEQIRKGTRAIIAPMHEAIKAALKSPSDCSDFIHKLLQTSHVEHAGIQSPTYVVSVSRHKDSVKDNTPEDYNTKQLRAAPSTKMLNLSDSLSKILRTYKSFTATISPSGNRINIGHEGKNNMIGLGIDVSKGIPKTGGGPSIIVTLPKSYWGEHWNSVSHPDLEKNNAKV